MCEIPPIISYLHGLGCLMLLMALDLLSRVFLVFFYLSHMYIYNSIISSATCPHGFHLFLQVVPSLVSHEFLSCFLPVFNRVHPAKGLKVLISAGYFPLCRHKCMSWSSILHWFNQYFG